MRKVGRGGAVGWIRVDGHEKKAEQLDGPTRHERRRPGDVLSPIMADFTSPPLHNASFLIGGD